MAFQVLFRLGDTAASGGYTGLLAFWMGGAASADTVTPPEQIPPFGGGWLSSRNRKRAERERKFHKLVEDAYRTLAARAEPAEFREVAQIVVPFVEGEPESGPPSIDFIGLAAHRSLALKLIGLADRIERRAAMESELRRQREYDDALALLLLSD